MPFYGGASPYPRRYGGGEGASSRPLLQVVYQALARSLGSAYDQSWPPTSAVGIETMAIARALTFDGYGANQRLANSFLPQKMTDATGMLSRWEKIFNVPPNPGDTEFTRRARVQAAWARLGVANTLQPMTDALSAALAPIFVKVVHQTPLTALSYWPGGTPYPGEPGAFYSTIAHIDVQLNQLVSGYHNNDTFSSPNAAFYALAAKIGPILDPLLPAWASYDWFILSSHSVMEFRLDEPNLSLEAFGS